MGETARKGAEGEAPGARESGAGLGLAITRHLIELHGGRIWAESKLGHGSSFTFTLLLAEGVALARYSTFPRRVTANSQARKTLATGMQRFDHQRM